jgi:thiol-disulfide isomerase/thioredoxin
MGMKKRVLLTSLQLFCIFFSGSAYVIIEGNIKNIPMNKVYLTNRGFASGPSFVLNVLDSCIADEKGFFYFKISSIVESNCYSIEFNTIKIGWIVLMPRKNEHIKIKAIIKERREIEEITGSSEYIIQRRIGKLVNPYHNKLNNYADSSSFYYETNSDSSKYYTKLNKLYDDSIRLVEMEFIVNNPGSTYSLLMLKGYMYDISRSSLKDKLQRFDQTIKQLKLYKDLFQFANSIEILSLDKTPPPIRVINKSEKKEQLNFETYKGRLIIIDFWASWCIPCREKIPELKSLYANLDLKKYGIISISIDKSSQSWRKALSMEKMPWNNYIVDPKVEYQILSNYLLTSIPKYIIVNKEGKVILITSSFDDLKNKIESIINDKML